MKKLALAAMLAALPLAALAETPTTAPATAPSTVGAPPIDTAAPGGPAAMGAKVDTKKVELQNGEWAEVSPDGSVKVSKDGGQTWAPAADGTLTDKTGNNIVVKGGMVQK